MPPLTRFPPKSRCGYHTQLMTRESPWAELTTDGGGYLELFEVLTRSLQSGVRPSIPAEARTHHPDFVAVMRRCWAGDPEDRPTFADVEAELSSTANAPPTTSAEQTFPSFSAIDALSEPLLGT